MNPVIVIGAGLAGCECAWQLAKRGVPVRLMEMKPLKRSGRGPLKSFCINEACPNFVPEDKRVYKKKAPAEKKNAAKKSTAKKSAAKKPAAKKTAKKEE